MRPLEVVLAGAILGLVGCAAPITQSASVSKLDLEREQLAQQRLAIESDWKAQTKLASVALPLLKAAVPFCGDRVTLRAGIQYSSLSSYKREWRAAAAAAGLSDTASVTVVVSGSAAAKAGLRPGDRLVGFDGRTLAPGPAAVSEAGRRFERRFAATAVRGANKLGITQAGVAAGNAYELPVSFTATVLPLQVSRGGNVLDVSVPLDTVCGQGVVAQKDDALNAFADGSAIYVTSAMMRFATEPGELETVVAHEIAHNAMRHIDAKKRNAAVGAFFGALLDVAAASQGVNTGGEYSKEFAQLGAMTFSQDFEREADYVGLYILARTGADLSNSANLWRRMATESPGSIKFATSHPTTADRYIRLDNAVSEIRRKAEAGQLLVPEIKGRK